MGLNLRPLRERAKLSITATSRALGVTHPAYIKWESGQGYPSADKLPAIAALFGCDIGELYSHATSIPTEGGQHHGA